MRFGEGLVTNCAGGIALLLREQGKVKRGEGNFFLMSSSSGRNDDYFFNRKKVATVRFRSESFVYFKRKISFESILEGG